jgi:hypothetical protein
MLTISRFGVEFAPEVVRSDGNVRNLAWRICNAKRVLVSPSSNPVHLGFYFRITRPSRSA